MWYKHVTERRFSKRLLLFFTMATVGINASAEFQADTIRLGLQQLEQRFMEKNLSLLAAKYNVDANKALIQQAKLWDNPVLVTDQNIYADHQFFAHGKDANGQLQGQYFIQVQQLIKTAGKRSKWVDMASTNARISELQFNEVMRNLKYQLRNDCFIIRQKIGIHRIYQKELSEINTLINGMNDQLSVGNIAKKDMLRLQAMEIAMRQELADNDRQLADAEADLKMLLQWNDQQFIEVAIPDHSFDVASLKLGSIIDTAKQYNSSFAIEQNQLLYQQQNLRYQKALKSPDLTIGPEYDHNSNYTPHYVGLSISLPLNIFNKNQGNIRSAAFAVKQEETNLLQIEQQLEINIQNALNKLRLTESLSTKKEQSFYNEYDTLYHNMTAGYRSRQISLIEFIDFFEAYRDTKINYLTQEQNLFQAKEDLNFLAGKDLFN